MFTQEQNANKPGSAFCNPLRRFPLPVAIAAALTLASIPSLNGGDQQGGAFRALLQPGLEAAFLWTVAAALWGESRKSAVTAWIAAAAGVAVIFVVLGYPWSIPAYLHGQWTPTRPPLGRPLALWEHNRHSLVFLPFVLFTLTLLVGLAPYLRAKSSGEAFWRFNQKLVFAALLALVGAVLLINGELALIHRVETYFSFRTPQALTLKDEIARLTPLLFVAPVLWLSMLPANFDQRPDCDAAPEPSLQVIALLVKFVFIPLIVVFSSIIILVYVGMAIAKDAVRQANLGDSANWLSMTIILTALLSYPIRREGGLLWAYWRIWPWLLVAPVICSAVAAYIDIEQRGVTPERCVLIGSVLGMAVISLVFLITRSNADIRLIPGALIATALLGSFGPWGAVAMSVRSQQAVIGDAFTAHALIKDGHWTGVASATIRWPDDERGRVLSSLTTLAQLDAVQTLANWFEGRGDDPFRGKAPFVKLHRMANLYGHGLPWNDPSIRLFFHVNKPLLLPLENARLLAGAYDVGFSDFMRQKNPKIVETGVAALGTLSMDYDANTLIIQSADGRRASFDLAPTVQRLVQQHTSNVSEHRVVMAAEDKPIILSSAENQLHIQLIVANLDAWAVREENSVKTSVATCHFYLLIG